jgi:hypothetical protein
LDVRKPLRGFPNTFRYLRGNPEREGARVEARRRGRRMGRLWLRLAAEAIKNAAKEAKDAARVGLGEREAAKQEAQIVAVGLAHGGRRVARGERDLVDDLSEAFEVGGGCGRRALRWLVGCAGGWFGLRGFRRGEARGQLIKADSDGLAEVHGGLAGMRGNLNQGVTEREIGAREAALFSAEDEGDAAAAVQFFLDERSERGQRHDGLLWFAAGERGGAEDEGAMGDGLLQGFRACGSCEEFFRADGGAGFAPVGLVGCDNGEAGEAEVGHGARGRADVERVARGDEDDVDRIEMGCGGQSFILERSV